MYGQVNVDEDFQLFKEIYVSSRYKEVLQGWSYGSAWTSKWLQRCGKKIPNRWLDTQASLLTISLGSIKRSFSTKRFQSLTLQHCHHGILFQLGLFEFNFLNKIYLFSTFPHITGGLTIHALLFCICLLSSKDCSKKMMYNQQKILTNVKHHYHQ